MTELEVFRRGTGEKILRSNRERCVESLIQNLHLTVGNHNTSAICHKGDLLCLVDHKNKKCSRAEYTCEAVVIRENFTKR